MAMPGGGDVGAPYRVPAQAIGCATATAARHLSDGLVGAGCHPAGAAVRWVLAQREGDVTALRRIEGGHHDRALYFRTHDVARDMSSGVISGIWRNLRDRAVTARAAIMNGSGGRWMAHWRMVLAAGVAIMLGWPVLRLMARWWGIRRARAICSALVTHHTDTLRLRRRKFRAPNSDGVSQP